MLNSKDVHRVFIDCFLRDEEVKDGRPISGIEWVGVHGVVLNAGFHKERLLSHKDDVKSFLNELDPKFSEGKSFIELPFDKDGRQWGEQVNAEQLYCLGKVFGWIKDIIPREMWKISLGVPFFVIDFDKMNAEEMISDEAE